MIFITLGSQKFQFNRLLKSIDQIFDKHQFSEEVFAQIGYSNYKPLYYQYQRFIDRVTFQKRMQQSDLVITHGGTGAIIGAVKAGKRVIAVPRLAKYDEHVDDHQKQIVKVFSDMGYVTPCYDVNDLYYLIKETKEKEIKTYRSNTKRYLSDISKFIDSF